MRILIAARNCRPDAGARCSARRTKPQIVDRAPDFGASGLHAGALSAGQPRAARPAARSTSSFAAVSRWTATRSATAMARRCNLRSSQAIGRFGVIRQLSRADLLEVLRQAAPAPAAAAWARASPSIVERGDEVEVLAGAASLGRFDLVVVPTASSRLSPARRRRSRDEGDGLGRLGLVGSLRIPRRTRSVTEYWGAEPLRRCLPHPRPAPGYGLRPDRRRSASGIGAAAAPSRAELCAGCKVVVARAVRGQAGRPSRHVLLEARRLPFRRTGSRGASC